MAGKIVDVTLRLKDQMSKALGTASANLQNSGKQWKNMGKDIEKAGRSISSVGSNMTKSVTMPILGIGGAAVKVAADFESGMDKVASISGATGSDLDKLSEKAKEMGKLTKFSATDSADAFSYMAMAGWKTKDMLDGIEGVMYLAGATGEDLATTSDIVTDALTAFGKSAEDTNSFVDVLAATSANANTNVSMLGESFKYVAPVAGSLNYSYQDVAHALGLMANSGIKASQAGTSLRSWLTRLASPTKQSAEAMDALGVSMTDSKGNMKSLEQLMRETRESFAGLTEEQKAARAAQLAGKTGMAGLLAVVNSSDKDFEKLAGAIGESNGAAKEMYNVANDNLNGQLIVLKSNVESLGISLGQKLIPLASKLVEKIQGVVDKFNAMDDSTQKTIIKIAGIAAAIGPVLLVIGKLTTGVGKVIGVVGKFGMAMKTAGGFVALITSPVGIAVGVIAGLIAVGVLLYKNWDKVKQGAKNAWGHVTKTLAGVGAKSGAVKKAFGGVIEQAKKLWEKIKDAGSGISKVIGKHLPDIVEHFRKKFEMSFSIVAGIATGLFTGISGVVSGIMKVLGGIIDFISGVFTGNWKKAWQGVKDIFGGIFKTLGALLKTPLNAVIGLINGAINGINKIGITIPKWVPKIGGQSFKPNIGTLAYLATGTDNWRGGAAVINEKGGELVDLPKGTRVYPHDESIKKAYKDGARSSSSNITINIPKLADSISVRSDGDIDKIAAALADKLEKVSQNLGGGEIGYSY
jgi:TP901 family phage tail tape measure protein